MRAIHKLVENGAMVAGQKPTDDPSLAGAPTKYTFADVKPYKANSPLQPSGLLGPVRVCPAATQ